MLLDAAPHRLLSYRYYSGAQAASSRVVKQNISKHCFRLTWHFATPRIDSNPAARFGRRTAAAVRRSVKVNASELDTFIGVCETCKPLISTARLQVVWWGSVGRDCKEHQQG